MSIERTLSKIFKNKVKMNRCLWKIIFENSLKSQVSIDSLKRNYEVIYNNCSVCDGYKTDCNNYYLKK